MPASLTLSPARSVALNRSFTDDGCDQPGANSHHGSLHGSLRGSLHSPSPNSHKKRIRMDQEQPIAETEALPSNNDDDDDVNDDGEEEEEEPRLSDIFGCNNTRTICGVKVLKENSSSGHGSRTWMTSSQSSVDSGSCPLSPTPSISKDDNSVSSHTTASHSAHNSTGWTLETKLARSQERRKRLEGRFQRERSKRRSSENDRKQVLKLVKGLLLGLEEEEEDIPSKKETSQRTISSIREFVSQQERRCQGHQSDCESSSHDDFEDYDDVHTFFTSKQQAHQKREEADSARKLRMLLNHRQPELPVWNNEEDDEEEEDESDDETSRPQYYDDSSYDTSEAEDEFPELPVKFRSIEELRGYSEKEDDATEDTEIMSFSSMSDKEMRERDIQHEEEINKYKQELESLRIKFELSTKEHLQEMDSMERQFRDESLKREDLLERALTYAEHLEDVGRKKSKDISSKQKDLELLAHQHFQKIEALRREHRDDLRKQKEKASKENASRHSKELKNLKELFEEELAKQMKESNLRLAEESKALKKRHEKDLDDLAKIHENLMHVQKEEQRLVDGQKIKLQNLENSKLVQALQDRDATIEKLRTQGMQKNEELQQVKKTLNAHRSIIVSMEKQRKNKSKELKKARDMAVAAELASSTNTIRQLQEELRGRDARINELEELVLESKQAAGAQSDGNLHMNAKLQEQLQERIFEIATLRNEHAQAMNAVERHLVEEEKRHSEEISTLQNSMQDGETFEVQRLRKELEETEDYHIQELKTALRQKDDVLENIEKYYQKEMRNVQIVLDETKEQHARDVAAMVMDMDETKEKHAKHVTSLVSKMNAMRVGALHKPPSPTRNSPRRRTIEQEYDTTVAFHKSKMLDHSVKGNKKLTVSTWFSPAKAQNGDLDSTSPTVSTSCSSSVNDLADDERSISTLESRNSLPPRPNEEWNVAANNKGSIVTPFGSSNSFGRKRAPKNKLPPSLLTFVGGLVKTTP